MLFYSQIKREFSNASWKRGQTYFRDERVHDVRLEGEKVDGRIKGSEPTPYETSITMARGTIFNSKCSCPAHRVYETHCKHVAALAIWVVERGSLLRAGVARGALGVAASENEVVLAQAQRAAEDKRLKKLLQAHPYLALCRFVIRRDLMAGSIQGKDLQGRPFAIPITKEESTALLEYVRNEEEALGKPEAAPGEAILYVRGMFQSKVLSALVVESAIRYFDPQTKQIQINVLTYLTRQPQPGLWKTSQGVLVQIPPPSEIADEEASFIQRVETTKVIYQGQAALDNLAKLLTHRYRDQIIFDTAVNVPVETIPLKLVSMNIGKKGDKERTLTYEFQGGGLTLSSDQLEDLAKYGRLSSNYVWAGDKIYQFETPLARLQQFANRSGVAAAEEGAAGESPKATPFSTLSDDPDHPLHPLAAYRLSLELGVTNMVVDPDWKEFHDWKKTFDKKKISSLPKIEYGFDLREYQKNGLTWLWSLYHRGLAGLLADEMGLGKTHQVLAFLSSLYAVKRNKPKHPSLVVAPTSVIAAWSQKLKKYDTGLKWHVFHGSGRTLPKTGVDVVLTTYGILYREPALREREWHTVVLDEAQAIKNASTISSRASRALKSTFRIAMTGTPVENQATDLWSLMEFLLPGYLGSIARFKRLYGWGRDSLSDVQAGALRRLISPFLLRRTKATVLKELPEKTEEVLFCDMTSVQKKAYTACLNSAEAERARANLLGTGKIDYANILALLTRLKQICDHPKLADITSGKVKKIGTVDPAATGKWETFQELLDEAMGSNLKVVVFTQYLGMIDLIGAHLEKNKIGYTELRGDTSDRGERMERFANDPDCRVFLCSLLAGGLGIDLTAGSVCIHFDRWWNPAKENQATDRLHRFGQTRGVQVFKLQVPGTVEDRIASIIQSKIDLSGALIEESAAGLKSFSRKELLDLLSPTFSEEEAFEKAQDEFEERMDAEFDADVRAGDEA